MMAVTVIVLHITMFHVYQDLIDSFELKIFPSFLLKKIKKLHLLHMQLIGHVLEAPIRFISLAIFWTGFAY